jgi:hypothetical protein
LGPVAGPVLVDGGEADEACVAGFLPAGAGVGEGVIVVESFVAFGCT